MTQRCERLRPRSAQTDPSQGSVRGIRAAGWSLHLWDCNVLWDIQQL